MSFARPVTFWIAMLAALLAVVVLLREVLLPFVAGMVLAYLLDPLASRMERLGMNRMLATLVIMAVVVITVAGLMLLTVPILVREVAYFIESFPLYVRRLHALAVDPGHPWLSNIVGEGLAQAERSLGELTTIATNWLGAFVRSIWSGGRALISVFSLAIVTPIVACYLLYDWNRMLAAADNWVPPARRDTVRALAREIDDTIGGFVRGQSALCLVLAIYYATALWLLGLKHGALIGFAAGLLSFIPYLGSLSGLVIATCIAIAQFWPSWASILVVPAHLLRRAVVGGLCLVAVFRRPAHPPEPGMGDVCVVRVWLSVRLCRAVDRGSACSRHRRPHALCHAAVLCKPALCRRCRCAASAGGGCIVAHREWAECRPDGPAPSP